MRVLRPAGRARRLTAVGLLAALALAGCASSTAGRGPGGGAGGAGAAAHSTGAEGASVAMQHGATGTGVGGCASHMPGEILAPGDAVVSFSAEQVCLGYVTIAAGTPVGWHNRGDEPATVTVSATDPVDTHTVAPGETWTRPFTEPGVYAYRVDVLPAFVGTVEVVDRSR